MGAELCPRLPCEEGPAQGGDIATPPEAHPPQRLWAFLSYPYPHFTSPPPLHCSIMPEPTSLPPLSPGTSLRLWTQGTVTQASPKDSSVMALQEAPQHHCGDSCSPPAGQPQHCAHGLPPVPSLSGWMVCSFPSGRDLRARGQEWGGKQGCESEPVHPPNKASLSYFSGSGHGADQVCAST